MSKIGSPNLNRARADHANRAAWFVALAIVASLGCGGEARRPTEPVTTVATAGHLEIHRASARTATKGSSANFTGDVTVSQLFGATGNTRATGGSVTFEPGARSFWHSHPAGQTLIVTAGTGWVQEWGSARQEMKAGDVVWTPPGVKHWHGASETEGVTHLAIQEAVQGITVTWLEPVGDAQYRAEDAAP